MKYTIPDINNIPIANSFKTDYWKYATNFHVSIDNSRLADPLHVHSFAQLWFVRRGSYKHGFRDSEFILTEGALTIIPPYFPHRIDTREGDCELWRCEFEDSFILANPDIEFKNSMFNLIFLEPVLSASKNILPYHHFSDTATAELDTIMNELYHEFRKKDSFSTMFVRANIMRLFACISREYNIAEHDREYIRYRQSLDNALTYINSHYTEKLYLDDICKIAMINSHTFSYLFKQLIGMSFQKYVQYLRVLRTQELLATTTRKQYDIAVSCGFCNVSHFHRVFKEFIGESPQEYRIKNSSLSDIKE